MKRMKSIWILGALAMSSIPTSANAQSWKGKEKSEDRRERPRRGRAGPMVLLRKLDLTATQKLQMARIMLTHGPQVILERGNFASLRTKLAQSPLLAPDEGPSEGDLAQLDAVAESLSLAVAEAAIAARETLTPKQVETLTLMVAHLAMGRLRGAGSMGDEPGMGMGMGPGHGPGNPPGMHPPGFGPPQGPPGFPPPRGGPRMRPPFPPPWHHGAKPGSREGRVPHHARTKDADKRPDQARGYHGRGHQGPDQNKRPLHGGPVFAELWKRQMAPYKKLGKDLSTEQEIELRKLGSEIQSQRQKLQARIDSLRLKVTGQLLAEDLDKDAIRATAKDLGRAMADRIKLAAKHGSQTREIVGDRALERHLSKLSPPELKRMIEPDSSGGRGRMQRNRHPEIRGPARSNNPGARGNDSRNKWRRGRGNHDRCQKRDLGRDQTRQRSGHPKKGPAATPDRETNELDEAAPEESEADTHEKRWKTDADDAGDANDAGDADDTGGLFGPPMDPNSVEGNDSQWSLLNSILEDDVEVFKTTAFGFENDQQPNRPSVANDQELTEMFF